MRTDKLKAQKTREKENAVFINRAPVSLLRRPRQAVLPAAKFQLVVAHGVKNRLVIDDGFKEQATPLQHFKIWNNSYERWHDDNTNTCMWLNGDGH